MERPGAVLLNLEISLTGQEPDATTARVIGDLDRAVGTEEGDAAVLQPDLPSLGDARAVIGTEPDIDCRLKDHDGQGGGEAGSRHDEVAGPDA